MFSGLTSRYRTLKQGVARARMLLGKLNPRRRQAARQREQFYEFAWRRAAESLDLEFDDLGDGFFAIGSGDNQTRVWRNYTSLDDPVALRLAGNKRIVHRLLHRIGAPSPDYSAFSVATPEIGWRFIQETDHPCVVKPTKNTGAGEGVTTGVVTRARFTKAVALASAFGSELLVERQVDGSNYRLLYLDGELVDAIERRPPSVEGDGNSSVSQLVNRENLLRLEQGWRRAQTLIQIDGDMRATLAKRGWTLRSRPCESEQVELKTVINENRAAENVSVTSTICNEIVDTGRLAAHALGVRWAGVDVICEDIQRPLEATGGVILEVNTAPGLYHHYRPEQHDCPVATRILAACLSHPSVSLAVHAVS